MIRSNLGKALENLPISKSQRIEEELLEKASKKKKRVIIREPEVSKSDSEESDREEIIEPLSVK